MINKNFLFFASANKPLAAAFEIMAILISAGYEAYIVGGAVRDFFTGMTPHDSDIAASCLPEETIQTLSKYGYKTFQSGRAYGTVGVLAGGYQIEVTTFRRDGIYSDSRRPDSVSFTRSLADDLARRDFTMNALAADIKGYITDLFDGKSDIENKIIRTVGDPYLRFAEDALRMIRAIRFSAYLGFAIDEAAKSASAELSHKITNVSKERVSVEIELILLSDNPERFSLLGELGLLRHICPDTDHSAPTDLRHPSEMLEKRLDIRLGWLLAAYRGNYSSEKFLSSFTLNSGAKKSAVLIADGADELLKMSRVDEYRIKLMLKEYGHRIFRDILTVYKCFAGQCESEKAERVFDGIIGKGDPYNTSMLAVNGRDLAVLGFSGASIGRTLDYLLTLVINEPELNRSEYLLSEAKKIQLR